MVGLGNLGERYEQTRHNLGFMVLDALAEKILPLAKTKWQTDKKFNAQFIKISPKLFLMKPQTMMNASGFAVAKIAAFYKIEPENIWIVHDDLDLPLGKIKVRFGGAAAGHHGVESIISQLATDHFVRFRLGIGHPGRGSDYLAERFVLENFNQKEKNEVKKIIKKTLQALDLSLKEGITMAMNRFNIK